MSSKDKEPAENIFCLFHRKIGCICIAPATDKKAIKMRFENAVTINKLNNKFEPDQKEKARRESEKVNFRRAPVPNGSVP